MVLLSLEDGCAVVLGAVVGVAVLESARIQEHINSYNNYMYSNVKCTKSLQ